MKEFIKPEIEIIELKDNVDTIRTSMTYPESGGSETPKIYWD